MSLNKYDKEVQKETKIRDSLILAEIIAIYNSIRDKSFLLTAKAKSKAGDNDRFFNTTKRKKALAKKINNTLKDDYIKRDTFVKNVYAEEYRTSYFYANYATENYGISKGYKVKLSRYTKDQFKEALNYSMSVIMDTQEMTIRRKQATKQIYRTILNGVENGYSQEKINKNIEIDLGYRDAQTGKFIKSKKAMRGQAYKTKRLIRTEINRIRNDASRDQWINEQDIVKSKYQAVEVLDNRTRRQSAIMDGDYSNSKGEFKYPNGEWHFLGRSGVKKWDINDRGDAISVDTEFPPKSRIQRNVKTGKNKVVPFKNFEQYAKEQGLVKNRYGEYLFGKPTKGTVKKIAKTTKPKSIKSVKEATQKKATQKVVSKPVTTKKIKQHTYTSTEKNTLDSYAKDDYKQINKYLREGSLDGASVSKETMDKWVKTLDDSISKNSLSKDIIVYRGASGFRNPKELLGTTINSSAFSSTSTSLSSAKSFAGIGEDRVLFKIKAPKGTNYVNMKQFESGASVGENEVLFGRNKKLKITNIQEEKIGDVVIRTILEGEYI